MTEVKSFTEEKLTELVNEFIADINDIKKLSSITLGDFKTYLQSRGKITKLTDTNKSLIIKIVKDKLKLLQKHHYLGGESLPEDIRLEIYKFLPTPTKCNEITKNGERCSKAFRYTDDKGNKMNCEKYCLQNCDKWIDDVLDNLPVSLTIDDAKFKIQEIKFIIYKNDEFGSGKIVYNHYTSMKKNRWYTSHVNEKGLKTKEVKQLLCSDLSELKDNGYLEVVIRGKVNKSDQDKMIIINNKYRKNPEITSISLLNEEGKRWFTPKWNFNKPLSRFENDIRITKKYMFYEDDEEYNEEEIDWGQDESENEED